jgi:hypothetical protein
VSTMPALTHILARSPALFEAKRISVVQRSVDRLDTLPAKYSEAASVYLSKNRLSSLAGIGQFENGDPICRICRIPPAACAAHMGLTGVGGRARATVRVLSLDSNLVADIDELRQLQPCSQLEVLSLKENPVSSLPYFRWHVIYRLPSLRCLNKADVTPMERGRAAAVIAREASTLQLMARNEYQIAQLRESLHRLNMHQEFYRMAHGRAGNLNTSDAFTLPNMLDPNRLLEMRQQQSSPAAAEQAAVQVAKLRLWVKELRWSQSLSQSAAALPHHHASSSTRLGRSQDSQTSSELEENAPALSRRLITEPSYDRSLRDSSVTSAVLRAQAQQASRQHSLDAGSSAASRFKCTVSPYKHSICTVHSY